MAVAEKDLLIKQPEVPRPSIEWPTVGLSFAVVGTLLFSAWAYFHTGPAWIGLWVLLNSIAIYVTFTLIHEASHHNISRAHPWLNDGLGYLGGFLMHGSFKQFPAIHMRHHAHTNDPAQDPDYHAAGPINPLKWSFTISFYFRFYLREKFFWKQSGKAQVILPYLVIFAIYGWGLFTGHLRHVFFLWGLPTLIGTAVTIFFFDYMTHYPHKETGKYTNSQTVVGKGWGCFSMQQGYHVVHHLWPSIPWYRYGQVYRLCREDFQKAGNREIVL